MNTKQKLLVIFFAIISAILLTGYVGVSHKPPKEPYTDAIFLSTLQEDTINLQTQAAKKQNINTTITIPAQFKVMTNRTSNIYAPVDGKVTGVYVSQGQEIKKGQTLVQMQSDYIGRIQSELLQSIIELDSNIKISNAQVALAKSTFERESVLLEEKITSKQEWESAKTQYDKEVSNLQALKTKRAATISMYQQRMSLYGADSSVASRVVASHKIHPFIVIRADKDGILLSRQVNPQEFVSANKELFSIADLKKIWLSGFLYSRDLADVKVGKAIKVQVDGAKVIESVLTFVAPSIDESTKTLEVRAEIDNSDNSIKPNRYAQMSITTGHSNAIAVNKEAIQQMGDVTVVYVKTAPGKYVERKVETGKADDEFVEIKSGLNEGDIVVTQGSFALLGESIKKEEEKLYVSER